MVFILYIILPQYQYRKDQTPFLKYASSSNIQKYGRVRQGVHAYSLTYMKPPDKPQHLYQHVLTQQSNEEFQLDIGK